MLISFAQLPQVSIPHLHGGNGSVLARMFQDSGGKIMLSTLPAGSSIGVHRHADSCEINYVLRGTGLAVCDGQEEPLQAGACHYCPKGSSHSIRNTGGEDLVLFTAVF